MERNEYNARSRGEKIQLKPVDSRQHLLSLLVLPQANA